MKKIIILFSILFTFLVACKQTEKSENIAIIKANQLGYYPKSVKKAIIAESKDSTFEIKNVDGKSVYKGKLSKSVFYDKSGENIRIADFTEFTETGTFYLTVSDAKEGFKFEIKPNIYQNAFIAVLKNYYYQRSGMEIEEKYAGQWKRASGHPDTLCYFHPSSMRGKGAMKSAKGWYDAGDCNKYVVNGGITVGTILNFYEMYPDFVTDGMTNIPESGNGKSDLLDEIRYELDWLLTMQMADGASNMKLSSKKFAGFVMPVEDTLPRFVIGKGTAPSLNFAAITAQATRIYKSIDPEFADKCLKASEKAWKWAMQNPEVVYTNPDDVQTGEYGDKNFTEEFWWASSELYITTRKPEYLKYLTDNEPYADMVVGDSWRNFVGNLGNFSILLADSSISKDLRLKVSKKLLILAEAILTKQEANPYRIFLDDFQWGSNSDVLNSAMVFAYAYKLTSEAKYLNAIVESVDYIFGKNATDYSFVTGFGSKTAKFIHHRASGADKIDEPVPGFVIGGPNAAKQDEGSGVNYDNKLPAKSYMDVEASFASNEVCINWNAPAVFVLGFLEVNAYKLD